MDPEFFTYPEEFMGWLENYHVKARELWLGFYKKNKGKTQHIDYKNAVETALCYGWIDGKTISIDQFSYAVRFTPRKPDSTWSRININRVEQLLKAGLMHPSGIAAYEKRNPEKSGIYSFELEQARLTTEMEAEFRENLHAWRFFTGSSPSYKKTCIYWIMVAKLEVTRQKRFRILLDCSAQGVKIPLL